MLFSIFLAIIGYTAVRAQSDGCPAVRIEGTSKFHVASGRYEVLPSANCSNRNVYKQNGGIRYMFYMESEAKWLVGNFICNLTVLFHVDDNSPYPESITETWYEFDSAVGNFIENPRMEVKCDDEFAGCSDLALSGSTLHESYNGRYEGLPITEMCHGRYTYKHVSENYYIFALDSWYVGPVNCERAVIKFYDGAFYPENITNVGTEYTGSAWLFTGVKIACYDPSKTTTTTTTTTTPTPTPTTTPTPTPTPTTTTATTTPTTTKLVSAGVLVHATTYVTVACLLVAVVGCQA